MGIDNHDKRILDTIQDDFPLARRPWAEIAKNLNSTEEDILSRVKKLYNKGIIQRVRPVLDTRSLGLKASTLIAVKVPEDKIEKIASVINSFKEVSHNYKREHEYNLWFTLTADSEAKLNSLLEEIKRRTNISDRDILDLRTAKIFKIGVRFRIK